MRVVRRPASAEVRRRLRLTPEEAPGAAPSTPGAGLRRVRPIVSGAPRPHRGSGAARAAGRRVGARMFQTPWRPRAGAVRRATARPWSTRAGEGRAPDGVHGGGGGETRPPRN